MCTSYRFKNWHLITYISIGEDMLIDNRMAIQVWQKISSSIWWFLSTQWQFGSCEKLREKWMTQTTIAIDYIELIPTRICMGRHDYILDQISTQYSKARQNYSVYRQMTIWDSSCYWRWQRKRTPWSILSFTYLSSFGLSEVYRMSTAITLGKNQMNQVIIQAIIRFE